MGAKARGSHVKRSNARENQACANIFPLLALPWDVQSLVFSLITDGDLLSILRSSKAMARQVMRHSSGRLQLTIQDCSETGLTAIRHVLHWAPPASMKLKVCCRHLDPCSGVSGAPTLKDSNKILHHILFNVSQPKLKSLTEVHFEGMVLPWLFPPGLADTCPNVHTLHIKSCKIATGNKHSKWCSKVAAANIRRLRLEHTSFEGLHEVTPPTGLQVQQQQQQQQQQPNMSANARTEQHGSASTTVPERLQSSLPNITGVEVDSIHLARQIIHVWGHQLAELQITLLSTKRSAVQLQNFVMLQKLVTPSWNLCKTKHLKALLQLPHLTHLELDSIVGMKEDLSNEPCSWQHLKLHLDGASVRIDDLSKVPLHSLKSPLILGRADEACNLPLTVVFPVVISSQSMKSIKSLAAQMAHVGVQLAFPTVNFRSPYLAATDFRLAAVLSTLSVFARPVTCVDFHSFVLGHDVLHVFGQAQYSTIRQLAVDVRSFMGGAHLLLDRVLPLLPAMGRLELFCDETMVVHDRDSMEWVARLSQRLMSALSSQPAGRQLIVCLSNLCCVLSTSQLVSEVVRGQQVPSMRVEFTAHSDSDDDIDRLVLSFKRSTGRCLPAACHPQSMFQSCTRNLYDYITPLLAPTRH